MEYTRHYPLTNLDSSFSHTIFTLQHNWSEPNYYYCSFLFFCFFLDLLIWIVNSFHSFRYEKKIFFFCFRSNVITKIINCLFKFIHWLLFSYRFPKCFIAEHGNILHLIRFLSNTRFVIITLLIINSSLFKSKFEPLYSTSFCTEFTYKHRFFNYFRYIYNLALYIYHNIE